MKITNKHLRNIFKSLTSRLTDYSASKFEVIEAEQKSSNYTIIKTKILPNDGSPEIRLIGEFLLKIPKNL